jgi:hypothetical protein
MARATGEVHRRAWVWEEVVRGRGHGEPVDALTMLLRCSRDMCHYLYIFMV